MSKYTWQDDVNKYIDAVSVPSPTPGGGSVAAVAGAMGCALAMMAVGTTLKLKKTPEESKPPLQNALDKMAVLKDNLKGFSLQDASAYQEYLDLKKAKADISQTAAALERAALVPVSTAKACIEVLQICSAVRGYVSPIIMSDSLCAVHLLKAALKSCIENIKINIGWIQNDALQKRLAEELSLIGSYIRDEE